MTGTAVVDRATAGTGPSTHPLSRVLRAGRPLVCGILNVTPDSFSDGGLFDSLDRAVRHGCALAAEGADLIDIGGESTRPGARPPTLTEELDRVVPVVEALAGQATVPLSVDTSRPEVMRAAVAAGASMVNDVRALQRPGALAAVAELGVPVCLMHMQRAPETMQEDPRYQDVVAEVRAFLAERVVACLDAGVRPENLVIDPGFGFGKTLEHNVALLASLDAFTRLGFPVMVGLSRKSVVGQLTGRTVGDRLPGSLAAALVAVQRGASVLRVHDVAATRDVLTVLAAVGTA
ncbi:dihydropteroate synthase [Geodermatophilus sabuli]|uniref:Dihydropteroate synthase n=1 Tax=Geodermatophilus sabuli TaxID=1564158 RepID=A0A285EE74_9ACTN|nr:dihydropteroate synthase [Geodermatophilus sabuli]MBB3084518.1 dihydropteroate synthase [Geodermatophilus sabuli]SNX97287.1 dihydropteroate synthase [Geodermatophilus sabuli]